MIKFNTCPIVFNVKPMQSLLTTCKNSLFAVFHTTLNSFINKTKCQKDLIVHMFLVNKLKIKNYYMLFAILFKDFKSNIQPKIRKM